MFQGINAEAVTGAEKHDLIPNTDARDASHISQCKVHGDPPDDGGVMIPHNDAAGVRELTIVTIRVADGQNGNVRRRFRDVRAAVA